MVALAMVTAPTTMLTTEFRRLPTESTAEAVTPKALTWELTKAMDTVIISIWAM